LKRRLAAILAADVAGYTALMGADEAGTLGRLTDLRQEFLQPLIDEHHGRIVKLMGDGLLVEFASVVDAVACAIAWQEGVTEREEAAEEDKRLQFRIGINLGDVIVEGEDIHGDGVNVAARLEKLAEPEGICISSIVHESISNRVDAEFADAGEYEVKGLPRPIQVWRWPAEGVARLEAATLDLPEKPSIAILPFINMSGDPEQEYFADGLTEDIITRLSILRGLLVVDRSSSFALKGRAFRARDAATELGVRYVLEGSVRRAGDRVRIVTKLVDSRSNETPWAQRYDRQLTDVFAIQDEITQAIVIAMQVTLTDGEIVRSDPGTTTSVDAWEKFHQGILALLKYTPEDNLRARHLLEEALVHDPDYIDARVYLAWTYWQESRSGYTDDRRGNLATCRNIVDELKAMGASTANAKHLEAATLLIEHRHDEALEVSAEAVPMGPCKLFGYTPAALTKFYSGDLKTALDVLRTTVRIYPYTPSDTVYMMAYSLCLAGDHKEAVNTAEEYMRRVPTDLFAYTLLATAYAFSGEMGQARETIENFRKLYPTFTLTDFVSHEPFRDQKELQRVAAALREAGLPE